MAATLDAAKAGDLQKLKELADADPSAVHATANEVRGPRGATPRYATHATPRNATQEEEEEEEEVGYDGCTSADNL